MAGVKPVTAHYFELGSLPHNTPLLVHVYPFEGYTYAVNVMRMPPDPTVNLTTWVGTAGRLIAGVTDDLGAFAINLYVLAKHFKCTIQQVQLPTDPPVPPLHSMIFDETGRNRALPVRANTQGENFFDTVARGFVRQARQAGQMAPIALPNWLKVKDETGKEQRACGVEIGMSGLRLSGGCMHADTPDAKCSWRANGICVWHTPHITAAALVKPVAAPVTTAATVTAPVAIAASVTTAAPVAIVAPAMPATAVAEPTKPNGLRQARKKH